MIKNVILVFLTSILFSCGNQNWSNFNSQKFTNLKSSLSKSGVAVYSDNHASLEVIKIVEDSTIQNSKCDSIYRTSGKVIVCTILSETDETIEFTDCPPSDSRYQLPKNLVVPNDEVVHYTPDSEVDCEVIWLSNGDSVVGQIVSQTKYYIKYKKCCSGCDTIYTDQFDSSQASITQNEFNTQSNGIGFGGLVILALLSLLLGLITFYFYLTKVNLFSSYKEPGTGALGFGTIFFLLLSLTLLIVAHLKRAKSGKKK